MQYLTISQLPFLKCCLERCGLSQTFHIVEELEENAPEENAPTAIIVTGFDDSTDEDTIRNYFSDRDASGGGPLETFEFDDDEDSFLIEFKNSSGQNALIL